MRRALVYGVKQARLQLGPIESSGRRATCHHNFFQSNELTPWVSSTRFLKVKRGVVAVAVKRPMHDAPKPPRGIEGVVSRIPSALLLACDSRRRASSRRARLDSNRSARCLGRGRVIPSCCHAHSVADGAGPSLQRLVCLPLPAMCACAWGLRSPLPSRLVCWPLGSHGSTNAHQHERESDEDLCRKSAL
jgi:hypothetical protein